MTNMTTTNINSTNAVSFNERQTVQVKSSKSLTAIPKAMPQSMLHDDMDASMVNEDSHGVALKAAKDKWNELGPLRLDDIVANSQIPID